MQTCHTLVDVLLDHLEDHAEKLRLVILFGNLLHAKEFYLFLHIADDFMIEIIAGLKREPQVKYCFLHTF